VAADGGPKRWCALNFDTRPDETGQGGAYSRRPAGQDASGCDIIVDQKLLQPAPPLHGQDGRQRVELQSVASRDRARGQQG